MYISEKLQKSYLLRTVLMLIVSLTICVLVYNNFSIYQKPIAKVASVSEEKYKDKQLQNIELKLMNTSDKGKSVSVHNKYDVSRVYDEKYSKGDIVFLNAKHTEIIGLKRDYFIAITFMILMSLLVIFGNKKGLLASLCLIVNVIFFYLIILAYMKGMNILVLTVLGSLGFTIIVLSLINGINKNMLVSLAATVAVSLIVLGLASALVYMSKIDYDFLDFIPEPYTRNQANQFFLAQIIIGCLGAVIDVAVTITVASSEVINKNPHIQINELMRSAKAVADDITGTMISVVLFTNIAAIIPTFIISVANDIEYKTVMRFDAYFDIVRFLMAAVAILIAIPVSVLVSSIMLKRGGKEI